MTYIDNKGILVSYSRQLCVVRLHLGMHQPRCHDINISHNQASWSPYVSVISAHDPESETLILFLIYFLGTILSIMALPATSLLVCSL